MTSPVAPDAAPSVSEFPALGDPAFNSKAYNWATAIPALVTWISGAIAKAYQNALSAFESSTSAAASSTAAAQSALVTAGSANFKGNWSGLTGQLLKPASAAYGGRVWLLLDDLADVTAAVPGVSPSWGAYDVLLPVEPVEGPNATMVSGYHYSVEYAGQVTLTMPPYVEGAMVFITIANGRYDTVLLRNAPTDSFMGKPPDDLTLTRRTTRCLRAINNSWRGL